MRQFHHAGVVTETPQEGEVFIEALRAWITDPTRHPRRLQWIRFAEDSPVRGPVRELPHFAFQVDDLDAELAGRKVLFGPVEARPGLRVAFIEEDGGVLELLHFAPDAGNPYSAG